MPAMKAMKKAAAPAKAQKRKNTTKDEGKPAKRAKVEEPKAKKEKKKQVDPVVEKINMVCSEVEDRAAESEYVFPMDHVCDTIRRVMMSKVEERLEVEEKFVDVCVTEVFDKLKTSLDTAVAEKTAVVETVTATHATAEATKNTAETKWTEDSTTESEKNAVMEEKNAAHEAAITAKNDAEKAVDTIKDEGETNGTYLEQCKGKFEFMTKYAECTPATDKAGKKEVKEFMNFLEKKCEMDKTMHSSFTTALSTYPREGFTKMCWDAAVTFCTDYVTKIEGDIANQPQREADAATKVTECDAAIEVCKAALEEATTAHEAAVETTKASKTEMNEAEMALDTALEVKCDAEAELDNATTVQTSFTEAMTALTELRARTDVVVEEPVVEEVAAVEEEIVVNNDAEMVDAAEDNVEQEVVVEEKMKEPKAEKKEKVVFEDVQEEAVEEEAVEEEVVEDKENAATPKNADVERKMSQENVAAVEQEQPQHVMHEQSNWNQGYHQQQYNW